MDQRSLILDVSRVKELGRSLLCLCVLESHNSHHNTRSKEGKRDDEPKHAPTPAVTSELLGKGTGVRFIDLSAVLKEGRRVDVSDCEPHGRDMHSQDQIVANIPDGVKT